MAGVCSKLEPNEAAGTGSAALTGLNGDVSLNEIDDFSVLEQGDSTRRGWSLDVFGEDEVATTTAGVVGDVACRTVLPSSLSCSGWSLLTLSNMTCGNSVTFRLRPLR